MRPATPIPWRRRQEKRRQLQARERLNIDRRNERAMGFDSDSLLLFSVQRIETLLHRHQPCEWDTFEGLGT